MEKLSYGVQYSQDQLRLWVHCSSGETVGRYDLRFGMDIHYTVNEQIEGKPQCLHCTHEKPSWNDFLEFCKKAKELWNVDIDQSKINHH